MKTTITVENIDDVEVTLAITMPLHDWHALRRQLSDLYPSWKLARVIAKAIDKISEELQVEEIAE